MVLNQKYIELFDYHFSSHDLALDSSFRKYHHLVRELNLWTDNSIKIPDANRLFFTGVLFFPLLTSIDFSNDCGKLGFLEILLYFVDGTNLPHLQKIKAFETGTHANVDTTHTTKSLYLCVCFRYRHSLTHLEILEPYENYTLQLKDNHQKHLNLLTFFKKVTHLVLYCHLQDENVDCLISSAVISACPDLIDFRIVCNSEYTETTLEEAVYTEEYYPTIKGLQEAIHISASVPVRLKNVSLELRTINTACMDNILMNFPTSQLDNFMLSLDCKQEFHEWAAFTDTDTIEGFLKHIKLAKKASINSRYVGTLLTPKDNLKSILYPVHKIWSLSNKLMRSKPKIILEVHFANAKRKNALYYTLELENNTLKMFQVIGEIYFFSGEYTHFPMAPFYDTVFSEGIDEMFIEISDYDLAIRCRHLLERYSHVKKLDVSVKRGASVLKLRTRKNLVATAPQHLEQKEVHPIENRYLPIYLEINRELLATVTMDHLFTDLFVFDSFKITELPISAGKYDLKFKMETQFKHLILDLKIFGKCEAPVPVLVTLINFMDRTKLDLMFLANLEYHTVMDTPGLFNVADKKTCTARIEVWYRGCEELTASCGGNIIYNKLYSQIDKIKYL
ncbi:hypothetical protein HPULCUR_011504 [Helicostylum pulchrum]|uniref:Uncharacterized protein n=1 Tax=Helicostylum pulchrum TaxID=562976 RepID=A0ABP9YG99_9FUNG